MFIHNAPFREAGIRFAARGTLTRLPILFFLLTLLLPLFLSSCLRDPNDFSKLPSDQPTLQSDTLRLDTLLSRESSSTRLLMIYNRTRKPLNIEQINLQNGTGRGYRINVDGRSGDHFERIPIQPGDSIFVFVEATFPKEGSDLPTLVTDSLHIRCNGHSQYALLLAYRQNVESLRGVVITSPQTFTAQRPYLIEDSLVVAAGATLTLEAGVHILMKEKAKIVVNGTLHSQGRQDARVSIEGVRRDYLIPSVPYALVPGQWQEIVLGPDSYHNELHYTSVLNGVNGVICRPGTQAELPRLSMQGCRISNMTGMAVELNGGIYDLINCELSNSAGPCLSMLHGRLEGKQLSLVNLFVWERRTGPAFYYRLKEGESPLVTDRVELYNCLIDGAYGLRPMEGTAGGGEVWIERKLLPLIQARDCYLRAPIAQLQYSEYSFIQCVEAQKSPKDVYRLNGFDDKKAQYHFYYDFHPLANTPPAQMPHILSLHSIQDLTGAFHPIPPLTVGAYAPVDSLAPAPWWAVTPS